MRATPNRDRAGLAVLVVWFVGLPLLLGVPALRLLLPLVVLRTGRLEKRGQRAVELLARPAASNRAAVSIGRSLGLLLGVCWLL
jgi:hypothetical protein